MDNVSKLSRLCGKWVRTEGDVEYYETWSRVDSGIYRGVAEVCPAGESVRLTEDLFILILQGEMFYLAKPVENSMPTPFKAIPTTADTIEFKNAEYDFPSSIRYHLGSDNSLQINISGTVSGRSRAFTLLFKKNPCSDS